MRNGGVRYAAAVLPFGKLESRPGAALTVLLPLLGPRVAFDETGPFQWLPKLLVDLDQRLGNTMANRARLSIDPAAEDPYPHIVFAGVRLLEAADHVHQSVLRGERLDARTTHEALAAMTVDAAEPAFVAEPSSRVPARERRRRSRVS